MDRNRIPYEQTQLDTRKIRDYAKKVAEELVRKFNAEDHWIDTRVTEDVWEDETVTEKRWLGLREVQVTRRVNRPQTSIQRVRVPPPSLWLLRSGRPWSRRNRLQKRGDYGEESGRTTFYLYANGDLIRDEYYNYDGILDGRYFQGSRTEEKHPMDESDILSFDYGRDGKIWAPAKGVGLHARLSKLRKTGQ